MEFERIAELYNRCNPDEPLWPDDDRNVDIDETGVRGEKWNHKLARQIELSKAPVCQLFSGLRGTGKSTELRRLCARLEDPKRKNLEAVLIDADDVLDLTVEIDVSDVLALVLVHTDKVVNALEGRVGVPFKQEGPLHRLWSWLTTTDVEIDKLSAAPWSGGVGLDLKTNPSLRQRVRKVVAEHPSTFMRLVSDELRNLQWRAEKTGRSGLVVVFDSLEKLRGTSQSWRPVLDSAERIFANGAPYLKLPIHVLYTVPPALTRRMADKVTFLPMVKVRDQQGAPHAPGIEVIRALIKKRIPDNALAELFGGNHVDLRIRQLGLWAGGYPREIVRLLQTFLELESFPVSHETVEQILSREGNTYRGIVYDSGALEWLRGVHRSKRMITSTEADREAADLLLQNNVILRYLNDEEWVELHPSVAGMKELDDPPAPGSAKS